MQIFIVEQIGYSYYDDEISVIQGLFSSMEKAQAFVDMQDPDYKFEIHSRGVDVADHVVKYDIHGNVG